MVPLSLLFLMTVQLLQNQIPPSDAAIHKFPDVDVPFNGVLPKPVQYFHHPADEEATSAPAQNEEGRHRKEGVATTQDDDRGQKARFGFNHGSSSYGGGGGIDGHSTGSGLYSPTRIDFGGLIIGAIVGLGALIIIPKILHLFLYGSHYPNAFGSYSRSDMNNSSLLLSPEITNIISRIDDVITYNQIDSSACLQRAVCSYVQSRVKSGDVTNVDAALDAMFSNSIVSFLIDGSRFKSAVLIGKSGDACADAYPKCAFFEDSMLSTAKKVLLG